MRRLVWLVLAIMALCVTAMAQQAQSQAQGQATVGRDNDGNLVVVMDGKQVVVPASALGQLQMQTQSGSAATGTPVTGPVTPMQVGVTPGNVSISSITVNGTTSVTVPVTTVETKRFRWGSKTISVQGCDGNCKTWTRPAGSRIEVVSVKTENRQVAGQVQLDATPIVQQATSVSKAYTDQQVGALAAQVNAQRQTATVAVPVYTAPQQTQSQSQVLSTTAPVVKKGGGCGFWKCKLPIIGIAVAGTGCAVKWCRGGGNTVATIIGQRPGAGTGTSF